jgi:UPF0755 protein
MSLFFFLGGSVFLYSFWKNYESFKKTPLHFSSHHRIIHVKNGWGVGHLSHYLNTKNSLYFSFYFKLLATQYSEYSLLRAGEYQLPSQIIPLQLLKKLTSGSVKQHVFKIVEGENKWTILNHLFNKHRTLQFPKSMLYQKKAYERFVLKKLGIHSKSLEGWLYPETYHYIRGDSALSLIKRSYLSMKKVLNEEWKLRSNHLPLKNAYEALILASIIEKEAGHHDEKKRISCVFIRRLQKNMRLQTDPSVIYGIGEYFNGDITRKNLKTKNAYNTYRMKGLPITPIASPKRSSIHAALHPKKEKMLYFVANGKGGHTFTQTLKEHQQATRLWLKMKKK